MNNFKRILLKKLSSAQNFDVKGCGNGKLVVFDFLEENFGLLLK